MKLIVGLGNPGKEYVDTRHNIGFMCIDHYISYKNITEKWNKKFDGEYLLTSINGEKVLFLKPLTFMNLSGNSVRKIVDYYNIEIDDILIISDDLDLNIQVDQHQVEHHHQGSIFPHILGIYDRFQVHQVRSSFHMIQHHG